jgi:hypothetical protein
MVMTDEMKIWDKEFQDYLETVDVKYADYFASGEIMYNTITMCFATINGANLRAMRCNLRKDIYNEVINKHKEIWGKWHHFDVAGS